MDDNITQKSAKKFDCKSCGFVSSKKNDYMRHLLTAKHKMITNGLQNYALRIDEYQYQCSCGKHFKYRQGMHKHRVNCKLGLETTCQNSENPIIDVTMFMELVKQNKDLQNLLAQQASEYSIKQSELINKLVEREPVNNTTNNNINTTNNNHQKFNLNLFLNETCKDAMNIQEFIDKIKITFQDLLTIGNEGFVNGLSDIFLKELRELDISKRPIHCTDSKRETMYLKENDVWNKDDNENTKLKGIIEKIEYRNVAALQQWCNDNPDSKVNNTSNNLLRDKIYLETLQGDGRTREKIIKNISKEVIIDKEESV